MNDNSIKNGYISDSKNYYFIFKNIYSYLEKESLAKKYFNNKFNSTKNNTLLNNKNSYIIFNGKKKYFNEKQIFNLRDYNYIYFFYFMIK